MDTKVLFRSVLFFAIVTFSMQLKAQLPGAYDDVIISELIHLPIDKNIVFFQKHFEDAGWEQVEDFENSQRFIRPYGSGVASMFLDYTAKTHIVYQAHFKLELSTSYGATGNEAQVLYRELVKQFRQQYPNANVESMDKRGMGSATRIMLKRQHDESVVDDSKKWDVVTIWISNNGSDNPVLFVVFTDSKYKENWSKEIKQMSSVKPHHLEFLDIPIDGALNEFQEKLTSKGWVFKSAIEDQKRYFYQGIYQGMFAVLEVSCYGEKNNVYSVTLYFQDKNILSTLFDYFSKKIKKEYLSDEISEHESPERHSLSVSHDYYFYWEQDKCYHITTGEIFLEHSYEGTLSIEFVDTFNRDSFIENGIIGDGEIWKLPLKFTDEELYERVLVELEEM